MLFCEHIVKALFTWANKILMKKSNKKVLWFSLPLTTANNWINMH